MKFKLDENLPADVADVLNAAGHLWVVQENGLHIR
jgi:predicted nuclease of predicted toxin-antitoxin system